MENNNNSCAIIGCGAVGAATAFALVRSGLFSRLVLLDVNEKKARGEAMDIAHSVPYVRPVLVQAGDYDDLKDCGMIIITAGANQAPGETRLDLVRKNIAIFRSIIPEIIKRNRDAILLVVANPVDILTDVTLRLSGLPACRVIGSGTVLDTARLKYLMGRQLRVDPRNIHAFIIGEHGDSELPVWSSANVSGIDLHDFCRDFGEEHSFAPMDEIFEEVKNSAYRIIESKGATCYGIAVAIVRIVEAIVRDEKSVLPVSVLAQGHYGLPNLCLSLPSIVGREGVLRILDFPLNERESQQLHSSAKLLEEVLSDAAPLFDGKR